VNTWRIKSSPCAATIVGANHNRRSWAGSPRASGGPFRSALGVFVEPVISFDGTLWFAIAYTAVFSLGLCYTLQIWAQRHTPPAEAALILSLESVFAVLAGWILLAEVLSGIQAFGCALIFTAVLLSQFKERTLQGTIDRDHLVEGQ
jgi:drug/metabolite transporter (DMT)-like permease